MNSGNNLCNWLVSSAAWGTYNSITCSLAANDIVPLVCGSLEQNRGHGWLVLALPRSLLPPLMTSKTPTLQNISILTSHLSSQSVVRARHFVSGLFSVKSVDPHWKFSWSGGLKCRLKARVLRLPEIFLHNQVRICVLYFRSWRLMFYPGFKVPSGPEHVLFRSIRNHLTLLLKREHLKPDAGFNLSVDFYGFSVFFVRTDLCQWI